MHRDYSNTADAVELYLPWVTRFVESGATGQELMASECTTCQAARQARNRVLAPEQRSSAELQQKPWDSAPVLYARNVPRYYALLQRARLFARSKGRSYTGLWHKTSLCIATTGSCQ